MTDLYEAGALALAKPWGRAPNEHDRREAKRCIDAALKEVGGGEVERAIKNVEHAANVFDGHGKFSKRDHCRKAATTIRALQARVGELEGLIANYARIKKDFEEFDGDRRGHAVALCAAEEKLIQALGSNGDG